MRHKQIILGTVSICEIEDRNKIDTVATAAEGIRNVRLLSVSPNMKQGRTLMILAGNADGIMDAVYAIGVKAYELFKIKAKSPRIGVMDTVIFTPLQNATIDECKQLAKKFGKRMYQELNIPFFYHNYKNYSLYIDFVTLLTERGIKGLRDRIRSGLIKPTLGTSEMSKDSGFLFSFARKPTIRFIINISTYDPDISFRISQRLDCNSHAKLWASGTEVKNGDEKSFVIPEKFEGLKALGVTDEYMKIQQIHILIHNMEAVSLHHIYETVKYEVDYFSAEILSTEIYGLTPKKPLVDSGLFYGTEEMSERELIELAANKMKLGANGDFIPEVKVIEYLYEDKW